MTPHRTPTLAGYVVGSVARIPAILTDGPAAAWAFLMGTASWIVGVSNVRLLGLVLGAMLANLVVGALWAAINPRERFCVQKLYGGILGKAFRLLVIPVGSQIDALFLLSPFGGAADDATRPVVAFLMYALAIAETVSTLEKFVEARIIPKQLAAVIQRLQGEPQLPAGVRVSGEPPGLAVDRERNRRPEVR